MSDARESVEVAIRPATTCDAAAMSVLLGELGHPTTPSEATKRMTACAGVPGHRVMVAEIGSAVVGLVETHPVPFLDRDGPIVRITVLVVASGARRLGVGRALVAWAEAEAARVGASMVELTSAAHRADAHAFYRALGYEASTGVRFRKQL